MGMQEILPWILAAVGVGGFVLTWNRVVVSVTRAIDASKADTDNKINEETKKLLDSLRKLAEKFEEDQRTQDNRFGEVGTAIRQYVANVEKEMHQIEIWGRDNFVLKSDFMESTKRIEKAIDKMSEHIRDDIKVLTEKIEDVKRSSE